MNWGALGSGLGFWVSKAEAGRGSLAEVAFIRFVSMVITLLMSSAVPRLKREVHG
jgi:hypothetical protein